MKFLGPILLFLPVGIWMVTDQQRASKPGGTKPSGYRPPPGQGAPPGGGMPAPTGPIMRAIFASEGIAWPMPYPTNRPRQRATREDIILQAVKNGHFEHAFDEVMAWGAGYEARVPVSTKGLSIEGTIVNANMATQQHIADLLGWYIQTPKIADATFEQGAIRMPPMPQFAWVGPPANPQGDGSMGDADRMYQYGGPGGIVDRGLAKAYRVVQGGASEPVNDIVVNDGKLWVLNRAIFQHPDKAANYGWFAAPQDPGTKDTAVKPWLRKDAPGAYVIQGNPLPDGKHFTGSTFHTLPHTDYSQVLRFMGPTIQIRKQGSNDDWEEISTGKVLTDPVLSEILSFEGPLPMARHPGVPAIGSAAV